MNDRFGGKVICQDMNRGSSYLINKTLGTPDLFILAKTERLGLYF